MKTAFCETRNINMTYKDIDKLETLIQERIANEDTGIESSRWFSVSQVMRDTVNFYYAYIRHTGESQKNANIKAQEWLENERQRNANRTL